jgi:CheY-like chemotaxis protein
MTTILVVDDEPVIRDSIRELLESRGLDIETASTAQDAIACVSHLPPDLLIVDWMLGEEMDGLQLAQALRQSQPHLPTIVITGYPSDELQSQIDAISDTWLFSKPWPFDQFMQLITEVLEEHHEV